MKTGFVILNYDSWEMTRELAQKAASYKNIDAVVVVDNDSSDGSYGYLADIQHEKIRVIQSRRNGGYSYGNNCGAWICRDMGMEIVFFANPDVAVEEKDIQKILEQFEKTDYSVLSGVEYVRPGEMTQPPLWRRHGYWDDFWDCFFLWRVFGRKRAVLKLDENTKVQRAEMLKGSFFAIRLDDLVEIGGFDEQVFLYCEERILSKRTEDLGRKMGIVTDAAYIHTHSASIQNEYKMISSQMGMLYTSRLYYHKKYNKIGGVKYGLLLGAMKISLLGYGFRDVIRMWKRAGKADG